MDWLTSKLPFFIPLFCSHVPQQVRSGQVGGREGGSGGGRRIVLSACNLAKMFFPFNAVSPVFLTHLGPPPFNLSSKKRFTALREDSTDVDVNYRYILYMHIWLTHAVRYIYLLTQINSLKLKEASKTDGGRKRGRMSNESKASLWRSFFFFLNVLGGFAPACKFLKLLLIS